MLGELLGNYRVVSKIGEGGMGAVYRAQDEVLHRDVAIKVVSSRTVADKSAKQFLLEEARSASALSHPNVCTIYQVGEIGDQLYIVMELIEGKPLSALTEKDGLPVESVLRYGVQIAAALAHSHGRNIVHRDLKSANVMVTPDGLVKVLDFGLARRLRKENLDESALRTLDTRTGVTGGSTEQSTGGLTGTLPYLPPEVFRGAEADYRSDIWALGVVLYEAACGHLPFQGHTAFELSSAILHELPPSLPSWIPNGLWAIVQRCLAKEPQHRYQRASEVQAALEAVQSASMVGAAVAIAEPRGPLTIVHRGIRHLMVRDGDVLLLVGTMKGAFLLRSSADRTRWDVAGPYFHGQAIYSMLYNNRKHQLWASTSTFWGTILRSSDDFGKTWTNPVDANVKFPQDCGASLKNIWQVCLGRENEPETMYCGVEPAALFVSHDVGETWSLVRGLFDHPHRPRWKPGNGGLCLHTILLDPFESKRMYVAISSGGVYRTEDGGSTWEARNRGIEVAFQPDRKPEFGQCVHKMVLHPARPERLFLQHHWGLYRSNDRADSWERISNGVPSDFGFAMMMHPHDPDCVYILPIESDEFRCTPDGKLRVYRTRNAGASWEPLQRGLPQKRAYETVLRDAMTVDKLDPAGIYFGTRSGELFGSNDDGKNWKMILSGLPPVVCVKSAVMGEPRPPRRRPAGIEGHGAPKKPTSVGRTKTKQRKR
jgi:tRNA A-37 threonylcarbamoyl transferase component Bud32